MTRKVYLSAAGVRIQKAVDNLDASLASLDDIIIKEVQGANEINTLEVEEVYDAMLLAKKKLKKQIK